MNKGFLQAVDKKRIDAVLMERFGLSTMHPFQAEVIAHLLDGQSVLAVVATGAGKSLCYQLPSLLWDGGVLVVSPLVALMHHQAERMTALDISARALTGQLDESQQYRVLQEWREGHLKLLYVAPERLLEPRFRVTLGARPPQLLVVDEAHCISEWGYDFRPEYRRIRVFREHVGQPPILALTATATARVKADIRWHLTVDREPFALVEGSVDRPNLFLAVEMEADAVQQRRRVTELTRQAGGGVIIYAASRKSAERWAQYMQQELHESVLAYHAGLVPAQRRYIERGFASGSIRVVAATTAFGMGIDRGDIRRVIHVAVPESLDAYYQEIGRAGRDGRPAEVTMVIQPVDVYRRDQWIRDDRPDPDWVRMLVQRLSSSPRSRPVVWELDDQDTRTSVVLSLLEDRGVLSIAPTLGGIRVTRQTDDLASHGEAVVHRLTQLWEQRRALFEEMAGYIETPSCRREILLRYYGHEPGGIQPCCDQCQTAGGASTAKRPDGALAERLRSWRSQQALAMDVEPYIVLSDRDLMALAAKRPKNLRELGQTRGIGPKRLSRYGDQLLAIVANSTGGATDSRVDPASPRDRAVWHFQAGTPFSQVTEEVGRSESTVRSYLTDWIRETPKEDWLHYVGQWFSDQDYRDMAKIMEKMGTQRLRPLFEAAVGRFGFDQWDVARAVFDCQRQETS